MFLHRFRTQHWFLLSAILFAGLLLLLPQGTNPSIAAEETTTVPAPTPGPNYMPLIYRMPTPTPVPGWQIELFNNTDLSGSPASTMTKTYTHPAEEWGKNAPAAGVQEDGFSARFTRDVSFDAGTYAFYLTADDGARLYVDGGLVIDEWHGSLRGTATYRYETYLSAGPHEIIVEYYDDEGEARVRLLWLDEQTYPEWRAEYYSNPDLSGQPALVRNESSIGFDWGSGSPGSGIPADYFSARFTRAIYFSAGTRILYTEADDRVRVWVDKWAAGTEVIEDWDGSQRWNSGRQPMNEPGWYLVTIEYAEITSDAMLRYFDIYGASGGSWAVEYYDDYDWEEEDEDDVDVLARRDVDASENRMYDNEPGIDLDAGDMPDDIGTDDFGVRFTRYFSLDGKYRFTAQYDDGMRVWIDGDLVMDRWKSQGSVAEKVFERTLHDGYHVIKVEFYDGAGSAICRLTWRKV